MIDTWKWEHTMHQSGLIKILDIEYDHDANHSERWLLECQDCGRKWHQILSPINVDTHNIVHP